VRRIAILALLVAAGCGGGSGDDDRMPGPAPRSDEQVIRGWIAALNASRFDRAADYFARGAIVEQAEVFRLDPRVDAIVFNRGLPCRGDVTDIEREKGSTLAAFRLREGRAGRCAEGGSARVRFVIRQGLIREWRQLPEEPSGPLALSRARPRARA
jgi:hypothetical protein